MIKHLYLSQTIISCASMASSFVHRGIKECVPDKFLAMNSLWTVLQQFSQIKLTDVDDILRIITKIRSNLYLLEGISTNNSQDHHNRDKRLVLRKLHGILILHLGFFLGSLQKRPIDRKRRKEEEEVFKSLLFCLRDLSVNVGLNILSNIDEDEFEEAFSLIPRIYFGMDSLDILLNDNHADVPHVCYQIARSWMQHDPIIFKNFLERRTTITNTESFIFMLLRLASKKSMEHAIILNEFLKPLRMLVCCYHDSNFELRQILDVAILALQSRPSHVSLSLLNTLSDQRKIFYWRCVSRIEYEETDAAMTNNNRSEIADLAVDNLIMYGINVMKINNTEESCYLLNLIMKCTGDFIEDVTTPNTQMRMLQIIFEIIQQNYGHFINNGGSTYTSYDIINNDTASDEVLLLSTLECLGFCIGSRRNYVATDRFLAMNDNDTEMIYDILVFIAVDRHHYQDTESSEKCASVIILFSKIILLSNQISPVLVQKTVEVLCLFLASQNLRIMERTIDLLYVVFTRCGNKSKLLVNHGSASSSVSASLSSSIMISSELIYHIALLAPRDFIMDESRRKKLVHTFMVLVSHEMNGKIHGNYFQSIDRQRAPLIISFLVCIADGSYDDDNIIEPDNERISQKGRLRLHQRIKDVSVCMLMKLANNPCNRRMLAQSKGLIASLIHYARAMPTVTTTNVDDKKDVNDANDDNCCMIITEGTALSRNQMKELIFLISKSL